MELPRKPSEMFDRDDEWDNLARFAVDDAPGATLGVVSGRRRQGKTVAVKSNETVDLIWLALAGWVG